MSIDLAAIRNAVASMAKKEGLVAAYLHGSAATGRMDSASDIDIALAPPPRLSRGQRHDLRLRTIGALMEKFPGDADKFDVVILRDVPVLLQYNIIRRGQPLFERTRMERLDIELSVERAYDDEEPYLRRETDIILDRILSRSR